MCLISINHNNREYNQEILISVPSYNNATERCSFSRRLFVISATTAYSVRHNLLLGKESHVNTSHGNFLENIHWGILKKFTVKSPTLRQF